MKKTKYILIILILFLIFNINVFALNDGNDGDTGDDKTQTLENGWSSSYVGVRISVVGSDKKNVKASKNILNKSVSGLNFCSEIYPKTSGKTVTNCWKQNVSYNIDSANLPSDWVDNNKKNINLHEYFRTNDYDKLKKLIESFTTISSGDYVLVEPMLKIGSYYGTAYELLNSGKINIADFDESVFAGYSTNDNALIWKTIFLVENKPGLLDVNYSTRMADRLACLKSSSCGRGVGVYTYEELSYTGGIRIEKRRKNSDGTDGGIIYSDDTRIEFYLGANCTGLSLPLLINGTLDFPEAPVGYYSIRETEAPAKYEIDDTCYNYEVKKGQTVTAVIYNKTTCEQDLDEALKEIEPSLINVLVFNFKGYYSKRAEKLFELYKKYPDQNGLLNIKEPACKVVSCNSSLQSSNCLVAKVENNDSTTFNSFDLSCYDSSIQDHDTGKFLGFCKNNLSLYNNFAFLESPLNKIGINKFYSTSGSFLIRKIPHEEFSILGLVSNGGGIIARDYENDKDIIQLDPYIATADLSRTCYVLDSLNSSQSQTVSNFLKDDFGFQIYFGDNDNNLQADYLSFDKTSEEGPTIESTTITSEILSKLTQLYFSISSSITEFLNSIDFITPFQTKIYSQNIKYKLNKVYVEKMTGKTSINENEFKYYFEEVGVISKFTDTSPSAIKITTKYGTQGLEGVIPFAIEYNNKKSDYNSCKYIIDQKLVSNISSNKNNKLQLEFRIIDSRNPFVNRETKSNWCYNGKCDSDNKTVEKYILNKPNSLGLVYKDHILFPDEIIKNDPIYKITLTPPNIKTIRNYNKENKYDNYEQYCNNSGKCVNSFVYSLKNGVLEQYEDNSPIKNYGSINKLIVKGS